MSEAIQIQGQLIEPGEQKVIELDVTKQKTRNHTTIPVFINRAKQPGPVLLLTGGVHGDETNGIAIVRDIIRLGYNQPLLGTIICIPVVNIFAFINKSRRLPDGKDLNRVMPGSPRGSLASQLAYMFTSEVAALAEYVIDFHAGGRGLVNYPNIRCDFNQKENLKLAEIFDAPYTVNSRTIPKSIRKYYDQQGKVSLLYEGGKSLELDPYVIDTGVRGALNVMRHLGMQEGKVTNQHPERQLHKSTWIRAKHTGMFQHSIANGSRISKGAEIGMIRDAYGEYEFAVKAPYDMCVFGINTEPLIYKGDPLFHVAAVRDSSL